MNVFADAEEWSGPAFELFGADHRRMLTLIVLLEVLLLKRGRSAGPAARRRRRRLLASGLVAQELSYHAWRARTGTWRVDEMLPLHLCSASVWLGAAMLWTGSHRLYQWVYFAGISGAAVALATPDVGRFGAPHYRFWQFFASHGLILTAPLWMTFVEGARPAPRSRSCSVASAKLRSLRCSMLGVHQRCGSPSAPEARSSSTR